MGKHSTGSNIEVAALRYGVSKRLGHGGDHHKTCWEIKCSNCPNDFRAYWSPKAPPELMVKNLRVRGWEIGLGDKPLCPNCAHPVKAKALGSVATPPLKVVPADSGEVTTFPQEPYVDKGGRIYKAFTREQRVARAKKANAARQANKRMRERAALVQQQVADVCTVVMPQPMFDLTAQALAEYPIAGVEIIQPTMIFDEETTMTKHVPTPSLKISHKIFQLLDELFDPDKRLYKSGYTDARVASDVGTSEDVVAYVRRETYGELAEDPRITVLRDDIELLRMEAADMAKRIGTVLGELTNRVDQIASVTKGR